MGESAERQSAVGAPDAQIVKEISAPLYQAKGWLKFLGVLSIVYGVLMIFTLWGIIICWLPIWMGLVLLRAGTSVEVAYQSGDKTQLLTSLGKLRTYFTVGGIAAIVAVAVSIAAAILAGSAILASLARGMRPGAWGM